MSAPHWENDGCGNYFFSTIQPYLKQGLGHRLGTTGVLRSRGYPPMSLEPGNTDLDNKKVPTQNSSWTHKKRLKDSLALLCSLIPFQGEHYSEASALATSSGAPHF